MLRAQHPRGRWRLKKPSAMGSGVHADQHARRQQGVLNSPPLPFSARAWKHPTVLCLVQPGPAGFSESQSDCRAGQEEGDSGWSPQLLQAGGQGWQAAQGCSSVSQLATLRALQQYCHMAAPLQHTQLSAPSLPLPQALRQETHPSMGSPGRSSPPACQLSPLGKGHAAPTATLQWVEGRTRLQPTGVVLWERKMPAVTRAGYCSDRGALYSRWLSFGDRARTASSRGWLLAPRLHADSQHATTTAFQLLE